MKKIKVVGALIFLLSLALTFIFNYTSKSLSKHNALMSVMNEQKNFTQEISKNIFYFYKHPQSSTGVLDDSIKQFLQTMRNKEQGLQQSQKIRELWNRFYLHVQHFRDNIKVESPYSHILLEKGIKNIYNTNLKLIIESDKYIKKVQQEYEKRQERYKLLQYTLFVFLVLLLLYLFTQLKSIITFIQKFLYTSKNILSKSSIKELRPIEVTKGDGDVHEAQKNFNTLVEKINDSIKKSSDSIEYTHKSLKIVEQNIEDLVELIYTMHESPRDKEMRKKEDAIIQSFEELSNSANKLKNLQTDLQDLISYSRSKET